MGDSRPTNTFAQFSEALYNVLDRPVTWFRESVVVKNRPEYYWYHQQFRRVPTIDECYTDDIVCYTEANEQFKRDRIIDLRYESSNGSKRQREGYRLPLQRRML